MLTLRSLDKLGMTETLRPAGRPEGAQGRRPQAPFRSSAPKAALGAEMDDRIAAPFPVVTFQILWYNR